jgi:hypothetical protein
MAKQRHKLSLRDQLRGVRAAIESSKTPPQLVEGLKRRATELERQLKAGGRRPQKSRQRGPLHDLLGI